MKRLISMALMLVTMLTLCVTAFAADSITPANVTIKKTYTLNGGTAAPVEEISFTVESVSGVNGGSTGSLTIDTDNKVTTSGNVDTTFDISFPTYSKVGVYKYTVTEVEGSTLGVTYDTDPITVVVTVTNANTSVTDTEDAFVATIAIHKSTAEATSEDNKIDPVNDAAFTNIYDQGQLTVTKAVKGNLASNTKKFTIYVNFSGENVKSDITYAVAGGTAQTLSLANGTTTAEIELSNTQSAVFTNIPAGVTYTVEEDSKHILKTGEDPATTEEGYTVSYTNDDGEEEAAGLIGANDNDTVTVNNEKKTDVDTGITMDSIPYILIATITFAMVIMVVIRKRRSIEE